MTQRELSLGIITCMWGIILASAAATNQQDIEMLTKVLHSFFS